MQQGLVLLAWVTKSHTSLRDANKDLVGFHKQQEYESVFTNALESKMV